LTGVGAGVTAGLAFAAGVLAFLSPCVLPLIPSYRSFIGGASLGAPAEGGASAARRSRLGAFYQTLAFVAGFSLVFAALGAVFSAALGALGRASQIVNVVSGLIVVALGANFLLDFWKVLDIERRAHLKRRPAGLGGAALAGMAFGAGWAPCVGPILSSILLLAGTGESVARGLGLLFLYSLGLGLPFLLTGLFFSRARTILQRLRPHLPAIRTASGLFLIAMGALIALGRLQRFNVTLFSLASRLRDWEQARPGLSHALPALVLALSAAWGVVLGLRRRARGAEAFPRLRPRPWPLAAAAVLAALAVLTLAGVVSPWSFVALWLSYQGL
jgi:cytochrome c-type biogenesis protein